MLVVGARGKRRGGGRGGRLRLVLEVVDEGEDLGLAVLGPWAGARVSLDHALRGQEGLDFLSQLGDTVVLLYETRGRQ